MLLSTTRKLAARLFGGQPTAPGDDRGGRILLVIECLLNQNARDQGAATCPAMNQPLIELCLQHEVGLLQLPCPEVHALGWTRQRRQGQSIRAALDTADGRVRCHELARQTTQRVLQYMDAGFLVMAVIGGNEQSPGCAVHHAVADDPLSTLTADSGLLMTALQREFERQNIAIPIITLRDADAGKISSDLQRLQQMMALSPR